MLLFAVSCLRVPSCLLFLRSSICLELLTLARARFAKKKQLSRADIDELKALLSQPWFERDVLLTGGRTLQRIQQADSGGVYARIAGIISHGYTTCPCSAVISLRRCMCSLVLLGFSVFRDVCALLSLSLFRPGVRCVPSTPLPTAQYFCIA